MHRTYFIAFAILAATQAVIADGDIPVTEDGMAAGTTIPVASSLSAAAASFTSSSSLSLDDSPPAGVETPSTSALPISPMASPSSIGAGSSLSEEHDPPLKTSTLNKAGKTAPTHAGNTRTKTKSKAKCTTSKDLNGPKPTDHKKHKWCKHRHGDKHDKERRHYCKEHKDYKHHKIGDQSTTSSGLPSGVYTIQTIDVTYTITTSLTVTETQIAKTTDSATETQAATTPDSATETQAAKTPESVSGSVSIPSSVLDEAFPVETLPVTPSSPTPLYSTTDTATLTSVSNPSASVGSSPTSLLATPTDDPAPVPTELGGDDEILPAENEGVVEKGGEKTDDDGFREHESIHERHTRT